MRWKMFCRKRLAIVLGAVCLAACVPGVPSATALPATQTVALTQPASAAAPGTPTDTAALPTAESSAAPTSAAGPTLTPAPAATVGASGNGCPAQQPPASAANPPDVVATAGVACGATASLCACQVLEVRLAANLRWSLTVQDPAGALAPAAPNGWFDAALQSCVWRFTGQATGAANLAYNGRAICKPGAICTNFVILESFAVTVTN